MSAVPDGMLDLLQNTIGRALPDRLNPTVSELVSISVGWESDVYAFDLESGPANGRLREALVLRIYPGADAYAKSQREFQGMRQLVAAGYPVPRVLALERDASPLEKPFMIMEKVEGEMLWPHLFRSSEPQQSELLAMFCGLFVRLHRLDWRPFVDDPISIERGGPYAFADEWLELVRNALAQFHVPDADALLDWLEARRDRVPCIRPAPVHLDFHPANLLLRADGSAAVIDWTQIQVSDPRFDLAWTLMLVGAAEGWEWRDRILAEYERLAGAPIQELDWFEVAACGKRLFSVIVSIAAGPEALGMRPDAVAKMREGFGALRRVYQLFVTRTGLRLRDVEEMLAE
jgi:aminoglycoside phosphotransferase (APT) family kinase protein